MSYIVRFFKWMMRGIIHTAMEVIMWTVRQVISFLRFALPYIFRTIAAGLWTAAGLSFLGFLGVVRPAPELAKKLGAEWSEKAVLGGWFPSMHQPTLTKVLTVTAFIAIATGFALNISLFAFTVVWLWEHGDWLLTLL